MSDAFYVWRRSDGYVNATTHMPGDYMNRIGTVWTYTLLLKTPDWPTARDLIDKTEAAAAKGTDNARG